METKICSKCKEEKRLNEFNKKRGSCRQCDKNIHKHYYLNNKHRLNKKKIKIYINNGARRIKKKEKNIKKNISLLKNINKNKNYG
jgi:hypothetical protein